MKRSSTKVPRKGQCKKYPGNTSVKNSQEEPVQKVPRKDKCKKSQEKHITHLFWQKLSPIFHSSQLKLCFSAKPMTFLIFFVCWLFLLMRERLTPNLIGDSCLSCHRGFLVSNCATHAASSREPLLAKKDTFMPEFGQIKKLLEKKEKKERKREKGRKSNCATHVVWSREQLLAKKDTFCI